MDGLLLCARYAFAPNKLKYCGPDKNLELFQYCADNQQDLGLTKILKAFEVLYPYLELIARANGIADPFDQKVVEAYWVGNEFLENVWAKNLYGHLLEKQQLGKRIDRRSLKLILGKIPAGARAHHSFHVLNVFKRLGHAEIFHTLESMDSCRVSWGMVTALNGQTLKVESEPIILKKGKLALGDAIIRKVNFGLDGKKIALQPDVGDWVSFHWNWFCQKLSKKQTKNLDCYTRHSIFLANQTL